MKDKANKGYWQRLAKIYAPLMESDKKFYNAICGYIRDYLKSDMNTKNGTRKIFVSLLRIMALQSSK